MRAWGGIAGLQYALPSTWQPWQAAGLNLTRFVQARRRVEKYEVGRRGGISGGTVVWEVGQLGSWRGTQLARHVLMHLRPAYLSACPPTFRRPGRPHLCSLPA